MAAEGERTENTSAGHASGHAHHFTTGGGAGWGPVPPPSPDGHVAELLALLREVRSDLERLQSTDEITALRDESDGAMAEISGTGRVTPGLVARLRTRLEAAQPALSPLASVAGLVQSLALVEGTLSYPEPEERASMRPLPSGRARPGAYGPPAGHTPPGPSTGSDDDEWPDPADG
ncbi:hypothetical protein A4E84_30400 [Streptomyces qaidamensis]|uniref:Uncharacterized protein n=1 Tax=Streptomyces qaidamensis TaxID=1783515 RepID=A0A143C7M7_9ACTN|nr:hypothetical protein [Streptomyces qaidamensis]AMW13433.1 hypothetical protein A4E84_30400 [Streptomyces qaidamensis]